MTKIKQFKHIGNKQEINMISMVVQFRSEAPDFMIRRLPNPVSEAPNFMIRGLVEKDQKLLTS